MSNAQALGVAAFRKAGVHSSEGVDLILSVLTNTF